MRTSKYFTKKEPKKADGVFSLNGGEIAATITCMNIVVEVCTKNPNVFSEYLDILNDVKTARNKFNDLNDAMAKFNAGK